MVGDDHQAAKPKHAYARCAPGYGFRMALAGFDFVDGQWALKQYHNFINAKGDDIIYWLTPVRSWEYGFALPYGKDFLNSMTWEGVLDLTRGSMGLKLFDRFKEVRGYADWDQQLRSLVESECFEVIREHYRGLITNAEKSDEHETAAFLRRFRLLFLESIRNKNDPAEIQPHLHFLFHMCVLTDERQPAPYRLQAAEYLKEHFKKPVFHARFRLIKDDIRSLAAMHGKEPNKEFDNHKLANLFMAAKEAVDSAKQAKSFVSQIQRDHKALRCKLNELMTDDFASGLHERERPRKRKKAKTSTATNPLNNDDITAKPTRSAETTSSINDIHEMIESKEMASYMVKKLAAVAFKSAAEVSAATVEAEDNYSQLAEFLGISRRTLGRALSDLFDELKS